ncbi:hypothetical protein KFK09_016180 [Dendrobium nobile]|uniref:Uncharacterized protein n=1 Tax=Dendrobium nobile TaxID=94219 RepID=A0A8T3AYN2_DENNO|nr:hypothetical protein KFK09_016180 [Dendrobium nobile]
MDRVLKKDVPITHVKFFFKINLEDEFPIFIIEGRLNNFMSCNNVMHSNSFSNVTTLGSINQSRQKPSDSINKNFHENFKSTVRVHLGQLFHYVFQRSIILLFDNEFLNVFQNFQSGMLV